MGDMYTFIQSIVNDIKACQWPLVTPCGACSTVAITLLFGYLGAIVERFF